MQQKTVTKKLILYLVLALLILGASIVAISYAWLTRNTALRARNENMQILAPDVVVRDYEVYQYNAETNQVDKVTNAEGQYEMTQFDTIFLERNVYTPLLFVIDLGNVTPGALSVNVFCNSLHTDPAVKFTSNVVCLKAASGNTIEQYAITSNGGVVIDYESVGEDSPAGAAARKKLFDSAAEYFKTDTNKGQFCQVTTSGSGIDTEYIYAPKKTNVSFNLNLKASDLKDNEEDGSKIARVYLIVDYAQELVEAQGVQAFGTAMVSYTGNEPIPYPNDITTIYFETPKTDGH